MTYTRKRWLALVLLIAAPLAAITGLTVYFNLPHRSKLIHDPAEDNPELRAIFQDAEQQADEELKGTDRYQLGFIHHYWATKKRILKEKHGLEWRTPAELNPNARID